MDAKTGLTLALASSLLLFSATASMAGPPMFASPHANPIALSPDGDHVYVANTPDATVDVIATATNEVVTRIAVGVDPVGVAVRPDGNEVWVANHISDSVNVIDTDPTSPSEFHVIATVQAFDEATRSTRFDEPVGIAFASNEKAYVALSSENLVAIVDVPTYTVTGHLEIMSQDPRALTVRGDRLYVIPFESGNQTELAGCLGAEAINGDQCTFDILEHVVFNNNVLSLFYDADIVRDPNVPDRDLFVYDTATDELVDVVSSIGTLLYGVVVDSQGRVFISQTEARNDVNGRAGTLKQELVDLENRAFLNQIAVVDCSGDTCSAPTLIELEPLPPVHPGRDEALATPFGIEVSGDDSTLVVTAAGSNKLFTVDATSGAILGSVDVGWVPRGVALKSDGQGAPSQAWVLNAVENSVTVVEVSSTKNPRVLRTITLEDPTDPDVKLGRFAFNNAAASSTATFSCESCHPDGHTDQLIWVLGGPACTIDGCTQIPPRTTMPIRGLRDTQPYHWDGVPGDPYGGINGEFPQSAVDPNCTDQHSCIRNLIDGAMASTMCDVTNCPVNEAGLGGLLDEDERDAMGVFLISVPYPPARERPIDDDVTALGERGFFEFFHNDGRSTCGVGLCHAMPFWNGTNVGGSGMDAPTFRGMPDRWLLLPQGRSNIVELLSVTNASNNEVPWNPAKGFDELSMWALTFGTEENPALNRLTGGFGPMAPWQMFLEGSMGFSGSSGRQVTLNVATAGASGRSDTEGLLAIFERSDRDGVVQLEGEGIWLTGNGGEITTTFDGDIYTSGDSSHTRSELLDLAAAGEIVLTLTGRLGPNVDVNHPQPALWNNFDSELTTGAQDFPRLPQENPMVLFGAHIVNGSSVLIDGRRVAGDVNCAEGGTLPNCTNLRVSIAVDHAPTTTGMHLLQVQSPGGLLSNEYIIFVDETPAEATGLQVSPDGLRILVSKDLAGERWAIVANADDGSVTGNVFKPDGSEPSFLWCENSGPTGDGVTGFSCYGAPPCDDGSCSNDEWEFIADVELPDSFFEPQAGATGGSAGGGAAVEDASAGLRTSRDGKRTLVSKDAAGLRWAITLNDDGSVTGNVYDPAGGAPQFVWCSDAGNDGNPDEAARILRFDCSGAEACENGICLEEDWSVIGEVELPGSFFLP